MSGSGVWATWCAKSGACVVLLQHAGAHVVAVLDGEVPLRARQFRRSPFVSTSTPPATHSASLDRSGLTSRRRRCRRGRRASGRSRCVTVSVFSGCPGQHPRRHLDRLTLHAQRDHVLVEHAQPLRGRRADHGRRCPRRASSRGAAVPAASRCWRTVRRSTFGAGTERELERIGRRCRTTAAAMAPDASDTVTGANALPAMKPSCTACRQKSSKRPNALPSRLGQRAERRRPGVDLPRPEVAHERVRRRIDLARSAPRPVRASSGSRTAARSAAGRSTRSRRTRACRSTARGSASPRGSTGRAAAVSSS